MFWAVIAVNLGSAAFHWACLIYWRRRWMQRHVALEEAFERDKADEVHKARMLCTLLEVPSMDIKNCGTVQLRRGEMAHMVAAGGQRIGIRSSTDTQLEFIAI